MTRHCIGFAAALALCTATGAAHAQIKITFNSFAPPNYVFNKGMIDAWAKKVGQVTEGRVIVEIPPTSLAPPPQQWEMVTQGVADGAYIFNGFAQKRLLLPQLAQLPFATPSSQAQARALWRTHKRFFEPANEYAEVQLLGYFGSPAAQIWSLDKPFEKIDDLKNVKTWSPPGDQSRAISSLGASIVSGPAVQSYEIISKGVVNAFVGHNFDGAYTFNVGQFAKSVTELPGGMGSASFSIFLNKAKWNSIPKRDQDLIMTISGEELGKMNAIYDGLEAAAHERMAKEGKVKIIRPSNELLAGLREKWAFLADEWIANAATRKVDGKAAYKYYNDTVQELAK
jgi:TRAP-type C4-dicarboxylate transport system substrate-binding protein